MILQRSLPPPAIVALAVAVFLAGCSSAEAPPDGPGTRTIKQPLPGGWAAGGTLTVLRSRHTATLLQSGRVLFAGSGTAELYDPRSARSELVAPPSEPRRSHAATLLVDGNVLLTGGDPASARSTAEIYDTASRSFRAVGAMSVERAEHTATALLDGRVLVAGGGTSSAEAFDPATETFVPVGSMGFSRRNHAAARLADGRVLILGGVDDAHLAVGVVEVFDPATNTFSNHGNLAIARTGATATVLRTGAVLVGFGCSTVAPNSPGDCNGFGNTFLSTAEVYDPGSGSSVDLPSNGGSRKEHTATLLPSGRVLFTGGRPANPFEFEAPLPTTVVFDPATQQFSSAGSLSLGRLEHTATLLADGDVLVAGGAGTPHADVFAMPLPVEAPTGPLNAGRALHTVTRLLTGDVLVVGGEPSGGISVVSAELYSEGTGAFATLAATSERLEHTATVIDGGRVLVTGGRAPTFPSATAETYDPSSGTFSPTGSMATARSRHTATLLPTGQVLVAGGDVGLPGSTAELYDPASGTFSPTGDLPASFGGHLAVLLKTGKVLVASSQRAALYDPTTGTFTPTASPPLLGSGAATLLPDGKVLIAGGSETAPLAELYDPEQDQFTPAAALGGARVEASMALLPNGRAALAGGGVVFGAAVSQLYEPHLDAFVDVAPSIRASGAGGPRCCRPAISWWPGAETVRCARLSPARSSFATR